MYFSDEKNPEMKKYFFALILLVFLVSCKSKPKQTAAAPALNKTKQLIKKYGPILHGVWVKSDYIEKIRQTKSVLAAVDLVSGVTGMKIDTTRLAGDSLNVNVGWDNQNPGELTIWFVPGKNPSAVKFGLDELGYRIENGDTTLIYYQIYENKLYKTLYHKALNPNPDINASDGVNYAINKALIVGSYTIKSPAGKPGNVMFNNNGEVTGMAGVKKYFIENDLKPAPLKNLDMITFDQFSATEKSYTYMIKGNTLELYDAKPNANGSLMVKGAIKFVMVRKPKQIN